MGPPLRASTLLARSGLAAKFIKPEVGQAVAALVQSGRIAAPAPEALAVACLASTENIVAALITTGVLPGLLEPEELAAMKNRMAIFSEDPLTADVLRANVDTVAAFLSLPTSTADEQTPPPTVALAGYPLFLHQRRALAKVKSILARGGRVMLHMPTGSGKTRTAMNVVSEHLRDVEQGLVLWIASMGELLDQAAREFELAWSHLGSRQVDIHLAWGGRPWQPEYLTPGLLLASPQTLYQRQQKDQSFLSQLASKVTFVVFDEAHQSLARTYKDSLEGVAFTSVPPKPVLGLSATPGRTYVGGDEDLALAEMFEHEKVMLDTSGAGGTLNPVDYLIENGYLAQPEFRLLGVLADTIGAPAPAMTTSQYVAFVADAVLGLVSEGHVRIMVFARSVDEADLVAATLKAGGVLVESVNGDTPRAHRDTATRAYRMESRTPRVLVNFGVFTAGFDAPQTSAAVIARPTRSLVAYSQMVGRAVRGKKARGNERAVIATVVDPGNPEFGSIAQAFTNWNGMWEDQ